MKKNFTIALLAASFICSGTFAQKQAEKKPAPKTNAAPMSAEQEKVAADKKQQDEMAAWMTYMTPGPMHEMIAKSNGDWKEAVTFWMTPGGPPTTSESNCTNTMIMGNRYQESKHSGNMGGMPFEGTGVLGYDNAKKVFVSTWIDNMGTGIMFMEGKWDAANKTVHFLGKSIDPMTGKEMKVREEFKIISDNEQRLEMYVTQNGKEFKNMEIKFTR